MLQFCCLQDPGKNLFNMGEKSSDDSKLSGYKGLTMDRLVNSRIYKHPQEKSWGQNDQVFATS